MKFLKSKAILFLFVISFCFYGKSLAQGIEFGVLLGASNYYGDLNGQQVMPSQTHPAIGVLGRYDLAERWTVKGYFGYGRISGADSLSKNTADKQRNLSFFSDFYEVSAHIEFNLVRNTIGYNGRNSFIPYLYAGIGIFNFNPKATLNGVVYELQPLGTEGQNTTEYNDRVKYSLTDVCIPMGIGIKKKIGKNFSVGLDVGVRYTFTNYLDDVGGTYANVRVIERASGKIAAALSDRSIEVNPAGPTPMFSEGNRRSQKKVAMNDMYLIGGISIAYRFTPITVRCPRF